jgi:hypothetical protein
MSQQTQTGTLKFSRPNSESGDVVFMRAGQMEAGASIQGEYVGSLQNRFDDKKLDYKLEEVDNDGNKTGRTIVINGAGNLGYRMKDIALGTLVQIQYLGRSKITKGKMAGKESHSFDVLTA